MSPFKSCYSFDGKLNHIGDSNSAHPFGGLAKYKKYLITIGWLTIISQHTFAVINLQFAVIDLQFAVISLLFAVISL